MHHCRIKSMFNLQQRASINASGPPGVGMCKRQDKAQGGTLVSILSLCCLAKGISSARLTRPDRKPRLPSTNLETAAAQVSKPRVKVCFDEAWTIW